MKKIEFIGASGVGKSTLFNELLKQRRDLGLWKTPSEGRIELAKRLPVKTKQINISTLLLLCLKLNLITSKHSKIAVSVLKKYDKGEIYKTMIYKSMCKYNDLIDLMLKTTINNPNIEPYRKGVFIEFYMNLLLNDILFLEELSDDNLIVYDDGIIHNTSMFGNEDSFNLMVQKRPGILYEIFPQGVVFCDLDLEGSYIRRKKRINQGRGVILENNLSDEELRRISEGSIEDSNKKIALLEKYNIPVLKINMNNETRKNVDMIQQFISDF